MFKTTKTSWRRALVSFTRKFAGASNSTRSSTSRVLIGSLVGVGIGVGTLIGSNYKQFSLKSSPPNNVFPFTSSTPLKDLDPPSYGSREDAEFALREINEILKPDQISNSAAEIITHSDSYFNTHHAKPNEKPQIILFPSSTEEVSQILKILHKYSIPVVPTSGLTSLEGHYIHSRNGFALDLTRMDKIIQLNKQDLDVVVQPAVGWQDLNEYLEPEGLLFGPDPGPGAQIGGMIATSCSGTNAFKYGTIKENVLGLTVVLADGTIIKTRKRPRKSAAGYNLTNLFIGSEGTLGIVTEASLKLHIKPAEEVVSVVSFKTIEEAAKTAQDILQLGLAPNAIEIVDEAMMNFVNRSGSSEKQWLEKPTLFFKIGGSSSLIIKEQIKQIQKLAKENNNISFEFAGSKEESLLLWEARKLGLWSTIDYGKSIDPDMKVWTTDVAVPISKLSNMVKETTDDIVSHNFLKSVMGHIGDGNVHFLILYKDEQAAEAKGLVDRMVQRALDYEGTCTGEHGVGFGKREYLVNELGENTINAMRKIKLSFDPKRILNPDKIFKIDPNDTE